MGAGFGLVLFVAEATALLGAGVVGLKFDTQGPAAAVLSATRPHLPSLLGRILFLYVAASVLLGVVAQLLARCVSRRTRWTWMGVELAVLVTGLWAFHAVERPALFDDISFLRWPLEGLVNHVTPTQVWICGAVFLAVHVFFPLARMRQRTIKAALGLFILVGVWGLSLRWTKPEAGERHPLVLMVGIDAFRPDRLRALGSAREVAPNLEQFLTDATLFERAYTPIAQTEPAWRSLLTARWPHRTGVRYALTQESHWEKLPTFPSALNEAGYQTAFFTDCSRFNFQGPASGFAKRVQPPRGALNFALEKLRFRAVGVFGGNALGAWWLPELVNNRAIAGIHDPMGYAQRLADNLVEMAKVGPTLVAYHNTAAHFPGDPVYPYYRRFVSPNEPFERRVRMFFSPIAKGSRGGWNREGAEALYDELLSQADAQLGIVLDALKAEGLYEEATIVVFSDHGESFHADHPELAGATPVHGARLSAEENRILLALKLPKSKRGSSTPSRVSDLVRLVDLGPTLLDLLNVAPLERVDGVSVLPALRGESLESRWLYAETGFSHAQPDVFDPEHRVTAPRSFDAYHVRSDGVVEISSDAHEKILAEKDIGAFDGERWLIRAPVKNGEVREHCFGKCDEALLKLRTWLDDVSEIQHIEGTRVSSHSR